MHSAHNPAQAQSQAQAQTLPQPAAARNKAGGVAVAQIQSQIDALPAHFFKLAVARQMALALAIYYVKTTTLADINANEVKQLVGFKKVYEMLPSTLAECLLYDVQRQLSYFQCCY